MKCNTIVTHESPDLDAILSCYLLKKFGESKFPGVSNANIDFVSAGQQYKNKSNAELDREGIITVDTGGGRFDTHPDRNNKLDKSKLDRSAADLVAEYLDIINHSELKNIIEYTRIYDSTGISLKSTDQVHHLFSIQSLLQGLSIINKGNSAKHIKDGFKLVDCIRYSTIAKGDKNALKDMADIVISKLKNFTAQASSKEACQKIEQLIERLESNDKKSLPKNILDLTVNFLSIYEGAILAPSIEEQNIFDLCLNAIYIREKKWLEALDITKRESVIKRIGKTVICQIISENPFVIKASRYLYKSDITLFKEPNLQTTSLLIRNRGNIHDSIFTKLIAKIRIAESIESGIEIDYNKLELYGNLYNWFFHQSGKFIINGSLKANQFTPSKIPLNLLLQILYTEVELFLDVSEPSLYPDKYNSSISQYKLSKLRR